MPSEPAEPVEARGDNLEASAYGQGKADREPRAAARWIMTTTAANDGVADRTGSSVSDERALDPHEMKCMEIWGGTEPTEQPLKTPGLDGWIYARPYQGARAGGDIHYVSMCGAGNISRFLVADVAGHGEPVAELARDLRKLMRRHINNPDTSGLARAVNDEFAGLSGDGGFATAIMLTYFAPTDQLIVVNAGHPRPLWYEAADRQWRFLDASCAECDERGPRNLPLGVIPETGYEQFAVTLGKGDLILLGTDSLIEATDERGRMLGEEGLLALAREAPIGGPDDVGRTVLDRLERHRGGRPAEDDLTLVALHHNAEDPESPSLGERVVAMAKMIGLLPV